MNEPDEKSRRIFEAFRRYGLPVLGVAETIATRGASPGTTAMGAEQVFQQQEERQRQQKTQDEERTQAAMDRALREKVAGSQLRAGEREEEKYGREKGFSDEWRAGVDQLPDLTPTEKLMLKNAGPEKGVQFLIEKGKPDLARELLASRLASTEKVAGQRIESSAEIAGSRIAAGKEKVEKKTEADESGKAELKNNLITQIDIVRNHPGKFSGANIGQVTSFLPTESRDFKKQVQKLKSLVTLENLKYLKGAMSDKDVKFISEASSALDLAGKPEALERELSRLQTFISGAAASETAGNGQTQPETAAFDESKKKRLEELRAKKAAGTLR